MLDIDLPKEAILEICQPGQNDCVVAKWCDELNLYTHVNLNDAFLVVKQCCDATLEEKREMSVMEVIEFAVWNHAWNLFDNGDE